MKKILLLCMALLSLGFLADARKNPRFVHETVAVPGQQPRVIVISTGATELVLGVDDKGAVYTLHYGAKTGDGQQYLPLPSTKKEAYPALGGRFSDTPALHVRYADGTHNTELYYVSHETAAGDGVTTTTLHLKDYVTALEVDLVYEAFAASDVLRVHSEIYNGGKKGVELIDYASSSLELRAGQYMLRQFYGDWAKEMQIDDAVLTHGVKLVESRCGTKATQPANPSFMLSAGTSIRENEGEVIAGALCWSGNFRLSFEKDVREQLRVISGIHPQSSAWPLGAGERFITPEMIYTWSNEGAGGASRNLHRWARSHGIYGGDAVKPTLLNSWEGAYFSFTTQTLLDMIDDTAEMGLEMFVLDDGWFALEHPRNSDRAGLGDWEVNTDKLPEGIDHIASYAHSKGLKFGIWIEPEMVNPDSRLAGEHPEWIVCSPGRERPQWRNQWVLDLANPAVQDFVFGVFDRTLQLSPAIDYVKWDCNSIISSFGSPYLGTEQDRFYVSYVQGLYKVMRRIREKYPDVIVQSCSSGGGRVDYGMLRYCNEVWTSDDTDALERVRIQYGTSMIYPACVMGSHVSAVPNHQTRNVTPLKMRFDMAATGRLGMELQPKNLTEEEKALARRCIESYKGFRDLVYTGDLYRLTSPYESDYYAIMYVSPDKRRAVVYVFCTAYQHREACDFPLLLNGLDPALRYRVTEQNVDKSCWDGNGRSFTGAFLSGGGFAPRLYRSGDSAIFVLEAE